MLRLWPKKISVGLFPQQCWLRAGRGKLLSTSSMQGADTQDMLTAFDALLSEHAAVIGRGVSVTLTVSDTMAAIVGLPWQDALKRPAEYDAYAQICFEQIGRPLDDSWAMQSYFRHYRAMGLAYALPISLLEKLDSIARAHGVRLNSVLPASAAAFGHHRRPRKATAVLLLREAGRTSALVYGAAGLVDYVMEPVTRNTPESATRLLRRLAGAHEIAVVSDWAPGAADLVDWVAVIGQSLPQAAYRCLAQDAWS